MLLHTLVDYTSQHYVAAIATSILLAIIAKCFYELCINPLSRFPGPKHAAISRIPNLYHSTKGDLVDWVTELHTIYGSVVRVAPSELSYTAPEAWKGIYGHAGGGTKSTEKDPRFNGPSFNGASDIIRAKGPDHTRFRRNFSHAFSEKALRAQQPLINHYADMLIRKLHTRTRESPQTPTEMVHQYNLTTFDIMGDLTFGASLDLLAGTGDDSWVTAIFSSMKANALRRLGRYYPWTARITQMLVPRALKAKAAAHYKACMQRVDTRVDPARNIHKPDIWGIVLDKKETLRLSRAEMYSNSQIFMVAGTETTATALSGLTYHLLRNPEKMDKIVGEVRGAFQSDSEIELGKLTRLEYLNACIEEGLRMYPPVPNGIPRVAPGGGLLVCGEHVPAGTALSVNQWATYHDPHNFKRPNEFIPERWISDEYASDNKAALQPFSFGPRNCLGKK
ncbi:cytochrome P450 [Aspergillus taichungensis]|uniref:Cytochrome P450 n=1 Tax=Aspergillus taichungensis TaxID=482145 RepID=A0A2J5I6A2_9EURO|nr:cytochrome P450 [Aspergillus taichungensis]